MTKPRVQLKIENFGPIVEGTVEFKPLTFLIGPNNSGKSYVATLLYALAGVFDKGLDPFELVSSSALRDLDEFVKAKSREGVASLAISELPPSLRELASQSLIAQSRDAEQRIQAAIKQYLSVAELSQLVQRDGGKGRMLRISSTRSTDEKSLISIVVSNSSSSIDVTTSPSERIEPSTEVRSVDAWRDSAFATLVLGVHPWFNLVNEFGYTFRHVHYLPAGRSGILASWPLLTSLAVRRVSRTLGRQQADIAPLPGVIGDFLEDIIERFSPVVGSNGRNDERAALQPVLDIVEGQLLRGRVVIEERQPFAAELIY